MAPLKSALEKVKFSIWGPAGVERSLLIKLDFTVLIYFSLIWFLFGINRASYSTAYISGMGKALDFKGKDFNYMNTIYTVTYAVFQMPSTSLLTLARPRYVFVAANTLWSILTLVTFRVNHVWQVFVLEGFEGALSAICYVGAHYIYASWYKQTELGKRAAIFCGFGNIGNMAGGWIQSGLLGSLTHSHGLPAWRLIFIVVSVTTIPIALFGWFFIPDLPSHKHAWFLTPEEREFAAVRLGKSRKHSWDISVLWRVLFSWQFWLLPTIFMLYSLSVQMLANNVMPLWMASRGYTVIQENNYPTGVYACGIVATFFYAWLSDKIQSRWQASLCIGFTFIIGSSILLGGPYSSNGVYFFAFYLMGTTYAPQAVWYTWMAELTSHDEQLRAITTGFMNSFDFAFVSWWPLIFYPVTDAPNYHKGYLASLVTGAATVPIIIVIALLEKRGRRKGIIGRTPVDETAEVDGGSDSGDVKETGEYNNVTGEEALTKGATTIQPTVVSV